MYRAILFSPDGDYVTDYTRETIEEVQEELADQGSRWYFYPYEAIFSFDDQARYAKGINEKIVDAAFPIEHFKGLTIREAVEEVKTYIPPID